MNANWSPDLYSDFEQRIALTWAHAGYTHWLEEHPSSTPEERADTFVQFVEGGLSIALKFRDS